MKHLKIKSAAVKRLQKEYESYEIEEKRQHSKVETLKQEGVDQYELKKQVSSGQLTTQSTFQLIT